MAILNFINEIQAAGILKERDAVTVAVGNCNRNWEGQIKDKGDRVKIKSVGDVTIKTYTRNTDIDDPETATDAAQWLDITEENYFNVQVDDVDDTQSDEAILPELRRKAGVGFADTQDTFIFNKHTEIAAAQTVTQGALTSANVFSELVKIQRAMQRNKVPAGTKLILEISPEVAAKLILAKIVKDQNNSDTIKNGKIGEFFGMDIYVSTNVVVTGSGETVRSKCFARTKDAVTFAEQFTKLETYRPEKRFANAVKGIQVYGAKIVRPKELILCDLTCAAESAI